MRRYKGNRAHLADGKLATNPWNALDLQEPCQFPHSTKCLESLKRRVPHARSHSGQYGTEYSISAGGVDVELRSRRR